MGKQIWKFELVIEDLLAISMPRDAEILSVQTQNEIPYIWALVNPDNIREERCFEIFGTGHDIPCGMGAERKYIGTFQISEGLLVFHLFERINWFDVPIN